MTLVTLMLAVLLGLVYATLFYVVSRGLRLTAVVDLVWTTGMGIALFWLWKNYSTPHIRSDLVLILVGFWSIRLSWHIFSDRVLPMKEDRRYLRLKRYWGTRADRNVYFLFLAQVPAVLIFTLPVFAALSNGAERFRPADMLALAVAIIALLGEYIADLQLMRFKSAHANQMKVCNVGLWKYSRHPNYFFEWLFWWAFVFFSWGGEYFALSLAGPLFMYLFLTRISGIPHVEREALDKRGDAYLRYQQTTNSFWPWKPRRLPV